MIQSKDIGIFLGTLVDCGAKFFGGHIGEVMQNMMCPCVEYMFFLYLNFIIFLRIGIVYLKRNLFPVFLQVLKLGDGKQIGLAGENSKEMKNQLKRKCGYAVKDLKDLGVQISVSDQRDCKNTEEDYSK